jgi:hypothetical protein
VTTSVRIPDLEIGHILDGRSELGHLLVSGGELFSQLPMQSHLLGQVVPSILLLTEKSRLFSAAGHKGLQGGSELET